MATLTPTLTITSTDAFANESFSLSVTDSLTVENPMSQLSRMRTGDNPFGHGAGVILDEEITTDTFVYVKHTGLLASDGTTAANVSNDFIKLGNGDGDAVADIITLYPGEFAFFPVTKSDGSDGGAEVGGLKVTAASAAVLIEFCFWTRTAT
tara:strand:- start:1012 stop:1467 length:456 start_codon:yes stop_codon:yes gene_type:complete